MLYLSIIHYLNVLYCTVLYCTVLYCTVLYCTVLYCTVLYCTVLYCTILYYTIQYNATSSDDYDLGRLFSYVIDTVQSISWCLNAPPNFTASFLLFSSLWFSSYYFLLPFTSRMHLLFSLVFQIYTFQSAFESYMLSVNFLIFRNLESCRGFRKGISSNEKRKKEKLASRHGSVRTPLFAPCTFQAPVSYFLVGNK